MTLVPADVSLKWNVSSKRRYEACLSTNGNCETARRRSCRVATRAVLTASTITTLAFVFERSTRSVSIIPPGKWIACAKRHVISRANPPRSNGYAECASGKSDTTTTLRYVTRPVTATYASRDRVGTVFRLPVNIRPR